MVNQVYLQRTQKPRLIYAGLSRLYTPKSAMLRFSVHNVGIHVCAERGFFFYDIWLQVSCLENFFPCKNIFNVSIS